VSPARAWRAFAGLAAAAYVLIVLGAVVRAHGAGLACPDWPLCFGSLVPAFDTRVALEWGHRALAGGVSLGLVAAALWAWRDRSLRARSAWPLAVAFALLGVQVVLGGLTVLLGLAPWTVTSHLVVGNLFCGTLLWIALELRGTAPALERAAAASGRERAAVLAFAALLVVQLALGGLVSSHYAGLACGAFPTCDGAAWAPSLSGLVGLHVIHRFSGYALALAAGVLAVATRSGPLAARSRALVALVALQIALGATNVLLEVPIELTALHSAAAAAIGLVTTSLVRCALHARPVAAERARLRGSALEAA
jgi:cytochrome c oxidase assembly protein subunit 15